MDTGRDITQAKTLPVLPHVLKVLKGTVHSYSFTVRVFKAENNSARTCAIITFAGELIHPKEWRGLEVQGAVHCYPAVTEDDMRFKDGAIALGSSIFSPASEGNAAYIELEQVATMEFFQETKQLLQSNHGKLPDFFIDLTSVESLRKARVNELAFYFPELPKREDI